MMVLPGGRGKAGGKEQSATQPRKVQGFGCQVSVVQCTVLSVSRFRVHVCLHGQIMILKPDLVQHRLQLLFVYQMQIARIEIGKCIVH